MEKSKFGTDGIRGIYGKDLTEEVARRLGSALGRQGRVLIGRDNRPSSPTLLQAVAQGVRSVGGDCSAVGLTTTPALYYLLTQSDFTYAVMITASHNPPEHNGLKVFTKRGKPSAEEREAIEQAMREETLPSTHLPLLREEPERLGIYRRYLRENIGSLEGLTAVVDFAGGAAYALKGLLGALGAHVIPLNLRKNGDRINEGCGALHPETCRKETVRSGADIGFALDGDGDRIIAIDRDGTVLDGDRILYLLACRMKARKALARDRVALTVMSNSGVLRSLSERGITALSCAVGDSAVAEAMREERLNLGGEQSGHVILGDLLMTGDGLLVGAALLRSIRDDGPLSLTPPPHIYPQVTLNVAVADKNVAHRPDLQAIAAEIKEDIREGRVLLRASGTEELVRIMVEHPDERRATVAAERLRREVLRHASY